MRLFGLLKPSARESISQELSSTPPCLSDFATADFVKKFGADPTGPRALAFLAFLASGTTREIVQIEAKHASVRRWLCGRSLQTHTMSFKHLGAAWVLQRLRRSKAVWPFKRAPDAIARSEPKARVPLAKSQRHTPAKWVVEQGGRSFNGQTGKVRC